MGDNVNTAKQVRSNLTTNIFLLVINMAVGVALVPYFKETLGVSVYGLIPLATSVTNYVMLITNCLNSSVSRYLTLDIQQGKYEDANKTFNTAFFGIGALILALLPIALLIAWFAPSLFNVPDISHTVVSLLFILVFMSALIGIFRSNFMITLFAKNRLDYRNIINIVNTVLQIGLIVVLFNIYTPDLVFVGIAYLLSAVASLALAVYLSRKTCPSIAVRYRDCEWRNFLPMADTAFWLIVTDIGVLLCTNCSIIVVNLLFGPEIAGEYAIVVTWNTLLRSISTGVFGTLFTPLYYQYVAQNDFEILKSFSKQTTKILTLTIAFPMAFVCVFSPQLLTIWVGADMAHLSGLVWILVSYLIVVLPTLPIYSILVACNKVRFAGIVTLITGCLNLTMAFLLPSITNLGVYGVAFAEAIVLSLRCIIFVPWYISYVIKGPIFMYVKAIVPGVIAFMVLSVFGQITTSLLSIPSSFLLLFIIGVLTYTLYLGGVFMILLNKDEKALVLNLIPLKIMKKLPKIIQKYCL